MKMKEMLKLSPHRRRRILAGFMAFVLMFSNVLMEAQAAIPMISDGNGGFFLVDRDSDEDSGYQENVTGEPEGLEEPEAPEEEEYDFQIDIQPEIKLEDGEKQWTGGWISYEYKNSDGHQSLGQALLQSDKYQEEYGDLPLNLPGAWESDDDNILEVKPDGTAIVKGRGYVDVTFTYNASEVNDEQVTTSGGSSVSASTSKGTEAGGAGSGAADSEDTNKDGNEAAVPNEEETKAPAEGETEAVTEGETKASAEEETEASTEEETAAPTEEETEAATKEETAAPTEEETTAPSEEETEATTEAEKEAEASTEAETEAQAEEETEASEEKETEALADGSAATTEIAYDLFLMGSPSANPPELTAPPEETETQPVAPTEKETEAQTEAETESSTEAETEAETEEEKETETSTEAETEASTETKAAEETETETEAPTEAEDETKSETEGEPEFSAANTEGNGETNSETEAAPQTSGGSGSGSSGTSGNHVSSDESTADAYALEDGTELTWVVKIESDKVTVYSGEPYNDVLNLSMKAGDEWPEFGATHLKDMPEDPPYGVNVTLPDNGTWRSMDEDVISLTPEGAMTVKVDDGACEIAYSYTDESGEVAIAMWDVVIGVGIETVKRKCYVGSMEFNYGSIKGCSLKNGWSREESNQITIHYLSNSSKASERSGGEVAYCIEPGIWTEDTKYGNDSRYSISERTGDQIDTYWTKTYPKNYSNGQLNGTQVQSYLKKILAYGYEGGIYSYTSKVDVAKAIATQILVWEVIVGERDTSFGKVGANGSTEVKNSFTFNADFAAMVDKEYNRIAGNILNPSKLPADLNPGDWSKTQDADGYYSVTVTEPNGTLKYADITVQPADFEQSISDDGKTLTLRTRDIEKIKKDTKITVAVTKRTEAEILPWYSQGFRNKNYGQDCITYITGGSDGSSATKSTTVKAAVLNHELSFTKKVVKAERSEEPAPGQKFDIIVTFDGGDNEKTGALSYEYAPNTKYVFSLADGDTGTITNVPDGISPKVEESDPGEYWSTSISPPSSPNNYTYTITNTYKKVKATLPLYVEKTVEGPIVKGETFNFELYEGTKEEGASPIDEANITVDQDTKTSNTPLHTFEYTETGTHTYYVYETVGTAGGYTYVEDPVKITVNVNNNQGVLTSEINVNGISSSTATAKFTNYYKPESTTWTPSVKKTVSGDDEDPKKASRKFTFTLTGGGDGVEFGEKTSVSIKDDETESFDSIKFTKSGTYSFIITETGVDNVLIENVPEDIPGYKNGIAGAQTITVEVDDKDGQLTVTNVTGDTPVNDGSDVCVAATYEFTNTFDYEDIDWTPKVKKIVNSGVHKIPEENKPKFSFTLYETDEEYSETVREVVETVETHSGEVSFNAINYNTTGIHYYTIVEDTAKNMGYTQDSTVYNVKVEVDDSSEKDGTLVKTVTVNKKQGQNVSEQTADDSYGFEFTNTYAPNPTQTILKVKKHITEVVKRPVSFPVPGTSVPTFEFKLELIGANYGDCKQYVNMPEETSVKIPVNWNENDKPAEFGEIEFTRAGEYTFDISEVVPETPLPGYTYAEPQEVVVTVEDENGNLKVTGVKYGDNDNAEYAEFDNTYNPDKVSYIPSVTKKITGAKTPKDKTFTFIIQEDENNNNEDNCNYVMPDENGRTATVTGVGPASFGQITFNQPGTYKFTISEVEGNDNGYTYDPDPWTLSVRIVALGGSLAIREVIYENSNTLDTDVRSNNENYKTGNVTNQTCATFTNQYHVTPVSATQSVRKVITGDVTPNNKVFKFTRELVEHPVFEDSYGVAPFQPGNKPLFGIGADGSLSKAPDTERNLNNTITITGEGTATFPKYTFTAAGTYVFEIREEDTGIPGYHYDTFVWKVTYEIADEDGVLKIAEGSPKYEKFAGDGTKVEVDSSMIPNIGFLPVPGNGQVRVGGNNEIQPIDAGLSLSIDPSRLDGMNETVEGPNPDEITFTNTYTVEPTELALRIFKEIDGDIPADKSYDFQFSLSVVDDNTKNEVAAGNVVMPNDTITVTVGGSGSGSGYFDDIVFNKAGKYKFQIAEVTGDTRGFYYDTSVYDVEVTVDDIDSTLKVTGGTIRNENGELVGQGLDEPIDATASLSTRFTNKYTTASTTFDPQVRKTVEGQPTEDETFTFRILAAGEYGDYVEMPADDTVTVVGEGNAKFGQITFKHTGTYDFTILEEAGKNPYYTYDESEWTLTVEIVDNDSQLEVKDSSVAYKKAGAVNMEEAIFNNTYTIPGNLVIRKEVSGNRGERERDFNFTVELTDAAGASLQGEYQYTGSSTIQGVAAPADGVVVNGNMTVTLRHGQQITINDVPAGTKYTVTEAEADTEGYDTTVDVDGSAAEDVAEGTIVTSWTTTVEYENYRNRSGGTTPGGNPGGGPGGNPNSNILDNPTPLADLPDGMVPLGAAPMEQILDEDVPLAFLAPQTGDETPVGAFGVLALAALGLMGAFGFLGFRKKEDSE